MFSFIELIYSLTFFSLLIKLLGSLIFEQCLVLALIFVLYCCVLIISLFGGCVGVLLLRLLLFCFITFEFDCLLCLFAVDCCDCWFVVWGYCVAVCLLCCFYYASCCLNLI